MGTLARPARLAMAAVCCAALGSACSDEDDPPAADSGAPEDAAGGGADAGGGESEADAAAQGDAAGSALDATGGFEAPLNARAGAPMLSLPPASPFRALQLNLCNSGYADCYQEGKSIAEGIGVIRQVAADLVTLNEICEDDVVTELMPAMRETWPDDYVFWVFSPAESRNAGGPITCTDGQRYGVALIGHVAAASWTGFDFIGDRLSSQDTEQNEMRAYACAYAADSYYGCVTHLENDNGDVALLQCQEVMNPIVPQYWGASGGALPTVVGGDLNLSFRGSPDVQDCVPPGWFRKGDGDVQHIMATDDFTFDSSELLPMELTDHDAWLVRLVTPG